MDPLDPLRRVARDVTDPQLIARGIETLMWLAIIALAGWVALRISHALLRHTTAWRAAEPAGRMTPIIEGLLRYAIIFTALILMLDAVHVNVTPVLASATVLGLTLGFGAQYLIRDLLAGVFLIAEGTIQAGDVVRVVGNIGTTDLGTVERIALRALRIRKFSGELLTVPHGSIMWIGNLSRDYARAIVQIPIPYGANVSAALDGLREAAQTWAAAHGGDGPAEPKVDGIADLRDGAIVLQCSVLVAPGRENDAAAELRRNILEALARRGVMPGPPLGSPFPPSA